MDTLSSIDTFRQVVESGSFVAAAERLELSPATVSKRIMYVEERLGVRLLNRNTRKISLTDSGRLYFERCKTILEELQATERELGCDRSPRGTLRVTCPSFAAAGQLARLLAEYRIRYPQVLVDASFDDRLANLVEEGYDVALRLVSNKDSLPQGLVARPIRRESFYLAASREYVSRRGLPCSPADLARHDFVALRDLSWQSPAPIPQPRTALCCRSTASVVNAVACGIGIGPVPGMLLEDSLFKQLLIPVLPDHPLQRPTLYIVYMRRKFVSPKIAEFVEFILGSLSRAQDSGTESPRPGGRWSIESKSMAPALLAPGSQNGARTPSYSEPKRLLPP